MQGALTTPSQGKSKAKRPPIWGKGLAARKMRFGLLFAAPAFVFFGFFYLYPLFRTFQVSLYSWSLLDQPKFLGLTNYSRLLNDKEFLNAIWVSFYYAFGVCIPIWLVALGLALVFNQAFRFRQWYLTILLHSGSHFVDSVVIGLAVHVRSEIWPVHGDSTVVWLSPT